MTHAKIALSLFFLLSGATLDEYYLARAIQGEGAHLVDQSTGYVIGRSVLNRLDAGWCVSVRDCVDRGYWGVSNVPIPSQWAIDIAHDVLTRPDDPTICGVDRLWCHDVFYVFSLPDRRKLGIADVDVLSVELSASKVFGFVFCGKDTKWGELR